MEVDYVTEALLHVCNRCFIECRADEEKWVKSFDDGYHLLTGVPPENTPRNVLWQEKVDAETLKARLDKVGFLAK